MLRQLTSAKQRDRGKPQASSQKTKMDSELFELVQARDAQMFQKSVQLFEEKNQHLISTIQAIDEEVLAEWEARYLAKAHLAIKLRLATLASLMKSMLLPPEPEVEARAVARARDVQPFKSFASQQVAAFAKDQKENLRKIQQAQKKADKLFLETVKNTDVASLQHIAATIRTRLMCSRLISERENARSDALMSRDAQLTRSFERLYKDQIQHNDLLLRQLDDLDLDTIDAAALNGKTLKEYCFASS